MVSLFPQPGPILPTFPTLIIAGPYHSSAPIHLALTLNSDLGPKARTLLLAPSRAAFKHAMLQFNDCWLRTHSGNGTNGELAANVTVLYPPTPAHVSLLLSMLYVPGAESTHVDLHPKTALVVAPSLVILAEPSRYFLPSTESPLSSESMTLSSYLDLITRVFASITNLTSGNSAPRFALFDSQLDKFKLPLTFEPSRGTDEQPSDHQPRKILAFPHVEKLFQWVGVFEDDDSYVPSSQGDEVNPEEGSRKQLRLYRSGEEDDASVYHWTEVRRQGPWGIDETQFRWPSE